MGSIDALDYMRWGRNRNREKKGNNIARPNFKGRFVPLRIFSPSFKGFSLPDYSYKRSVYVSLSYARYDIRNLTNATKEKIKANTADTVEYFYRFEGLSGFNAEKDEVTKEECLKNFSNDAVFRMIISPEDPSVLSPTYIRQIMKHLEDKLGHKLKWTAVFHNNTDNPHSHVIISRTSGGSGLSWETPLKIDRTLISEGIRQYACELSERIIGKKSLSEYKHPFFDSQRKIGLARIDHVISGNKKKGTNLFVETSSDYSILSKEKLEKLPKWQQDLIFSRLEFLSEYTKSGFKKIGNEWRCYCPDTWKNILLDEEKLGRLSVKDNVIFDHADKPLLREYEGKVLECIIVDDNSQKVGLLIEENSGLKHYVESEMEFKVASSIVGKTVRVKARETKTERFRTPVVDVNPKAVR